MSIPPTPFCEFLAAREKPVAAWSEGSTSRLLGGTARSAMLHSFPQERPERPFGVAPQPPRPVPRFKRHVAVDPADIVFVAMLPAFRATGGLATGDEVGERFARRQHDGLPKLARRVAAGELISFDWHHSLWLPMFQFDHETMELNERVRQIFCELSGAMTGWEITQWFATPHAALRNAMPVEMLNSQLEAVLDAARLDRFIAQG